MTEKEPGTAKFLGPLMHAMLRHLDFLLSHLRVSEDSFEDFKQNNVLKKHFGDSGMQMGKITGNKDNSGDF